MTIPPGIFKSYDIRGVYPEEINEENIYFITQAIYQVQCEKLQKKSLTVVTGHDMRLSAPSLYPLLQKALIENGAHVVDIGLASTPTFYFAVFHYSYDAGIQLSASHNPSEYSGMKFVINTKNGLIKIGKSTGMDRVKEIALSNEKKHLGSSGSIIKKSNILNDEIDNAMSIFDTSAIKQFKVVADAANAMGAQYIEALFTRIPSQLIRMNFNLDGSFPSHQPNPIIPKNTEALRKKVIEEKADLGLAPDGDGDRMFFIDEKGETVSASIITALVAKELLKKHPGSQILYDIRYVNTAKKIIEECGGTSDVTKVGHAYITEKMHDTNAIFGGESSAHYFFKATGNAESQLPVIIAVLSVMSKENKTLSQLVKDLSRSFESGEYNFKTNNSTMIIDLLKHQYNNGDINTLDGIAISYVDWRFGVRTSNTEPLLRLNIEADSEHLMKNKRDELIAFIEKNGATIDHG